MKRLYKALLISFLLYIPLQGFSWGMTGHRVIGQIAYSYLSPKAKQEIKAIFGNESLALSTTWADFIRSDSNYNYLSPWHYVNFAPGLDFAGFNAFLKQDTAVDAYTKINVCIKELKKGTLDNTQKKLYLHMLVHMLGDVHMPYHTGRAEDRGGNNIHVLWYNQPTNMHAVWDGSMIDDQKLSFTEYTEAINFTTPAQREAWEKGGLNAWLFDSYQIVEKLYGENIQPNQKLGYVYTYKYLDTVNQQLLKAGVRLAYTLNQIFK